MEMKEIDMQDIVRNQKQPRQSFDHEKIIELANSIKEGELLQPIVVRSLKNNKYSIVCGERRYRACDYLKMKKIPAVIRDLKDSIDALEKSAIENWHREDLTDAEKRAVINELWESGKYESKEELSRKTGIHRNSINDYIEDKELHTRVQLPGEASHTLIRETKGLNDNIRKKLIKTAVKDGITATEIREEIVPKLKMFDDPEVQKEELERLVERRKQDKLLAEEEFARDVKIASGKMEPDRYISRDPDEIRFDILKEKCQAIFSVSPISITGIKNEKFRKKSIEILKKTENSLHSLLVLIGEYKVIEK